MFMSGLKMHCRVRTDQRRFPRIGISEMLVYGVINATLEKNDAGSGVLRSDKLSDSYSFVGLSEKEDFGGGNYAYLALQNLFDISGATTPAPIGSAGFTDYSERDITIGRQLQAPLFMGGGSREFF